MPIQNIAHLIQSAAMAAFGDLVVYLPVGGGSHEMTGIYSCPTVESNQGQVVADFTPGPRIELRKSELAAAGITMRDGDRLQREGETYRLGKALDDGQGGLTVLLEEIQP